MKSLGRRTRRRNTRGVEHTRQRSLLLKLRQTIIKSDIVVDGRFFPSWKRAASTEFKRSSGRSVEYRWLLFLAKRVRMGAHRLAGLKENAIFWHDWLFFFSTCGLTS